MSDPQKLSVENLGGGELAALIQRAFVKVGENICDPNVPTEGVRKIKAVIKIKPDKKAQTAQIVFQVSTELPGAEPGSAMAYIAMNQESKEITLYNADVQQEELFSPHKEPTVTNITPISPPVRAAAQFAPPLKAD